MKQQELTMLVLLLIEVVGCAFISESNYKKRNFNAWTGWLVASAFALLFALYLIDKNINN